MTTIRNPHAGGLPSPLEDVFTTHSHSHAVAEAKRFLAGAGISVVSAGVMVAIGSWHAAAVSLVGSAGFLAFKLWVDHDARGRLAIMDGPGGRKVTAGALAKIDIGSVGIARGNAWAVYETPDSDPIIMGNAEYDAFRRAASNIVEIRVDDDTISVGRYTSGEHDSSATGHPAIEIFDTHGDRMGTAWYVLGRQTGMTEALEAHALALDEASPGGFTP